MHNLQRRGCALLGIDDCPTLEAQRERFISHGWTNCMAHDMNTIYGALPRDDVQRSALGDGVMLALTPFAECRRLRCWMSSKSGS